MVKVSVIIPVYNTEKYIEECLDSVITQDMREWEVICIDDASTDGSAAIMKRYAEQDNRIRVITVEKNGGQAAGRNLGFVNAQGDYVYFLDSDDMLQAGALKRMCALMDKHQVDGMVFNARDFYETPELACEAPIFSGVSAVVEEKGIMDGESMFLAMCEEGHPCCQPGRFLWKRNFLLEEGILNDDETSPHEDELFFLRAVLSAKRMIAVAKEFHLRRYRPGSVMTGHTVEHDFRHCKSYLLLWLRSAEFFRDHNFLNQHCVEIVANYASMFLRGGLDYARKLPSEKRAKIKYNNFLDTVILQSILSESVTERRKEVFLREDTLQQLLQKERIFLYGAGVCGQKVLQLLLQYGCPREKLSFVVTDRQGKAEVFGLPVTDITSLQGIDEQKDIFIVAVTKRWQGEVATLLTKYRFPYVVLEDGYAVIPAPSFGNNDGR
ncbi:glycosyltransferase family 2 protein [Selenomonas ruminantium]|uniref:Glycosyltransferase involved in cell wall bisynthesis n=1 Tax=Selenomonas ruminantium TaxID=971 RepID=A0A1K1N9B4_SELRU|nr:glycosyltransferase family 2 protein [Selenomonas ruminantium]SFW32026.1 Glycosyltransferase involved in cell wall bisynthesis [Selenomonas ruminantium]